jgi:hypothetical protein
MITSYCILALNRVELAKHTGLFSLQIASEALINSVFLCAEPLASGLPGNQDALWQA